MTDHRSQLLPCPNPWCENGEPCLRQGVDRVTRAVWAYVSCTGCELPGPRRPSAEAAVASWNTRKDVDAAEAHEETWRDAEQPAPEGEPVMALYRAFNRPDGRWMKHVVWWREGGWRVYPFTGNKGFVERWRPLAAG